MCTCRSRRPATTKRELMRVGGDGYVPWFCKAKQMNFLSPKKLRTFTCFLLTCCSVIFCILLPFGSTVCVLFCWPLFSFTVCERQCFRTAVLREMPSFHTPGDLAESDHGSHLFLSDMGDRCHCLQHLDRPVRVRSQSLEAFPMCLHVWCQISHQCI